MSCDLPMNIEQTCKPLEIMCVDCLCGIDMLTYGTVAQHASNMSIIYVN